MIFTRTFAHYERLLHQKYAVSSTIRHKGERGRQRENGLLGFLRDNLPAAYGVATGEVIPYHGSDPSPQCDIIIYDRLRMPALGAMDAVQQVPLEAVYCIIECKSMIDAKALVDTSKKIRAIRKLPRCPSRRPLREGMEPGPLFTLFCFRLRSSTQRCTEFMSREALRHNVDIVALDCGCGIWISDRPDPVWLNATVKQAGFYETLLIFFVGLLDSLRSVDLGEPRFQEMLWSDD